jgi:hypothetical protein
MKPIVTPLHPRFVAKITDIDVGNPIDQDIKRAIERAMDEYALCVLPGQHLADEEQIAFSRLFGSLDSPRLRIGGRKRRIERKEIFDISNLDENGGILGEKDARSSVRLVTQLWHTDGASLQESASWSMLHARVIPPAGGDTEFTDTRAAYDALPEAMKRRLEGLIAEHSLWHASAKAGGYMPTGRSAKRTPRRDIRWCADIPAPDATRSILPRPHRTSSACRLRTARHHRGHHHRAVAVLRTPGHRPQFKLPVQGQGGRYSAGRARAGRALRAGGTRQAQRRPHPHHGAAH